MQVFKYYTTAVDPLPLSINCQFSKRTFVKVRANTRSMLTEKILEQNLWVLF